MDLGSLPPVSNQSGTARTGVGIRAGSATVETTTVILFCQFPGNLFTLVCLSVGVHIVAVTVKKKRSNIITAEVCVRCVCFLHVFQTLVCKKRTATTTHPPHHACIIKIQCSNTVQDTFEL